MSSVEGGNDIQRASGRKDAVERLLDHRWTQMDTDGLGHGEESVFILLKSSHDGGGLVSSVEGA